MLFLQALLAVRSARVCALDVPLRCCSSRLMIQSGRLKCCVSGSMPLSPALITISVSFWLRVSSE